MTLAPRSILTKNPPYKEFVVLGLLEDMDFQYDLYQNI